MTQSSAAQTVQQLLGQEQAILAELGTISERERAARQNLDRIRAAIEGIRLGQQLEQEAAAAAAVAPEAPEAAPEV